jgi:hypothetical protein
MPDGPLSGLPDFTGKVVLVYHVGSHDHASSAAVVGSNFELQGGRVFLCGTPAPGDSPNDWIVGCRICVAWETVESYIVFDSIEDYTARAEKGRATTRVQ